jgi:hypothetical protein
LRQREEREDDSGEKEGNRRDAETTSSSPLKNRDDRGKERRVSEPRGKEKGVKNREITHHFGP